LSFPIVRQQGNNPLCEPEFEGEWQPSDSQIYLVPGKS